MQFARRFFPPLDWLPDYERSNLSGDLSAGLTVGVMLIPQGMAYALIAGLPPIYGLYASLLPIVVYALFGTSRQLAVGPVAMVSLLVAAAVAPLADGNTEVYIMLAVTLALMVGLLQFAFGVARFGFLTNFLSHPVLAGFTSAAALIIGLSQLKHLLGVDIERSNYIHEILWGAIQQFQDIHPATLILGLAAIVLLVLLKRWKKTFPGSLAAVVLTTLAVWLLNLDQRGVEIVGEVPRGLPGPIMPSFDLANLEALLPMALTIALVGFMESIAVAKVYASKNRYEVDANQELVALGLANVAGAFFRAYPTTGGFSRTAVNAQAGARTPVAGLATAVVIALTLLFLTPLFFYMPNAVLAAIVMVAVFGLIEFREALFLWRIDKKDFFLMLLTFLATLGLGIEEGILVGVVASLIVFVHQTTRPHTAIMGRLPDTDSYRNVERHPEALTQSGVVIIRVDAPLFFGNSAYFREQIQEVQKRDTALKAVVLDAYPVNRVDATAVHTLKEVLDQLNRENVKLYMAGVKGPVRDMLESASFADQLGSDRFFLEVHDAVEAAEKDLYPEGPPPVKEPAPVH